MYIKYLQLYNYRNYNYLNLELGPSANVFIGDNAQGKTNILESVYYCGFGKSHRTNKDKELIKWNEEKSSISIYISKKRLDKKIDINILRNGKKGITINSIKIRKISDLIGSFNVVMFSPEDLRIIKESPGVRRRFMDMELCQIDKKYYYSLVQYNKVLQERNVLLRNRGLDKSMLDIYDIQLASFGKYIFNKRCEYVDKLNQYGSKIHNDITSNKENIFFKYISAVKNKDDIEEQLLSLLKEYRQKDMERGTTSIGIHRDDLSIYINKIEVKSYGSQGQQRTAVLTMKFSSLSILRDLTGEAPVLLLDDVLSELDFNRKRYILKSIKDVQTIITCTGVDEVEAYLSKDAKIFKVIDGNIIS